MLISQIENGSTYMKQRNVRWRNKKSSNTRRAIFECVLNKSREKSKQKYSIILIKCKVNAVRHSCGMSSALYVQ